MNIAVEVEIFVNIESWNAIFASALFQIRGALGAAVDRPRDDRGEK